MIKSMTGFGRCEESESGLVVSVEVKSLNGKNLEINCRLPRSLSSKELEIREIVRANIARGSLSVNVNVQNSSPAAQYEINEKAVQDIFTNINGVKKKLKLQGNVQISDLLHFSNFFFLPIENDTSEIEWRLTKKALREALKSLDKMRKIEGDKLFKDMAARMKTIKNTVGEIESLGMKRIPEERDKLRKRVAMLFESDEIDEHRLQLEIVLIADKLDISEECVRLSSHIKYFFEVFKEKEPPGRKIGFLLQEMNREINTIGSKANNSVISQTVVIVKEELERIREQIQNIE
ncbi:MAG: YicC family protein [Ignavibacteria bacterium]|nr:YicC family protein [Ignavibacteria bacterium]